MTPTFSFSETYFECSLISFSSCFELRLFRPEWPRSGGSFRDMPAMIDVLLCILVNSGAAGAPPQQRHKPDPTPQKMMPHRQGRVFASSLDSFTEEVNVVGGSSPEEGSLQVAAAELAGISFQKSNPTPAPTLSIADIWPTPAPTFPFQQKMLWGSTKSNQLVKMSSLSPTSFWHGQARNSGQLISLCTDRLSVECGWTVGAIATCQTCVKRLPIATLEQRC
jgi:hypothetical protein